MRPGQNKRSRNRNNSNNNGMNGQHQNNRPRPPHRTQSFESSGPNVKIRGNAYQVFERYVALAREAATSGDRIAAENYYQHAEHYFRIMNADGHGNPNQPRPMTPADTEMGPGGMDGEGDGDGSGEEDRPDNQAAGSSNMPESDTPPN